MRGMIGLMWIPVALLIVGIAVGLGCGFGTSPSGNNVIVPYDSTYTLAIGEGYPVMDGSTAPQVSILQTTDEVFPNYNYSIVNSVMIYQDRIRFNYHGILIPEVRLPAFGPARALTYLTMDNGVYALVFSKDKLLDIYEMTVDDTSIAVSAKAAGFTNLEHSIYWRYRPNSFALFCGSLTETSYLCDDIVDSLNAHIDLEEFFYPDNGVVAYGRESQGHYYDAPARYFYYNSKSDFEMAGEVLKQFTLSRPDEFPGVGISITNWLQDSHLSWQFQNR